MDAIKLLLTLCVAMFLALLTLLCLFGAVQVPQGGPDFKPHPGVALTAQIVFLGAAIWTSYLAYCALRASWRQVFSWEPPSPAVQPASAGAAIRQAVESNPNRGQFDLSRLTGAGWLLGFASVGVTVTLGFGVILYLEERLNIPVKGALGRMVVWPCVLLGMIFFGLGYWFLSRLGIRVILAPPADTKAVSDHFGDDPEDFECDE